MKRKFWNWVKNEGELSVERTLFLNGEISDETWYGDEVTPQLFKDELNADSGDITVWINSPGGDVFAAAQIYNMLRDYKGHVTVKIDGLAASAASVIAVAGDTVLVSPVAMMMIHNPATVAMGNTKDMEAAIAMLNEVKESILNAYVDKTGLSRNKLSKMMDDETWFNAKKAVELGFADRVLFDKEEEKKPDKEPKQEEPDEGEEGDEGESTKEGDEEEEKKKKFPFQQNAYAYSAKKVTDSFFSKVTNTAPCEPQIPIDQLRKRLDLLKR
ncbi:head maturation protease, ClpP-related [Oscillospiraceae bacterium LCP25S3_E3]